MSPKLRPVRNPPPPVPRFGRLRRKHRVNVSLAVIKEEGLTKDVFCRTRRVRLVSGRGRNRWVSVYLLPHNL
jgi:hypothetical protein